MRASTVEVKTSPTGVLRWGFVPWLRAEALPACSAASLALSLGCHGRCHTSVTNYADPLGSRCPDLHLCIHPGLTWTPEDGLYNLCQVVPSEGPRIRTGASSGPSKRYCRVFIGVSLTRLSLSSVTRCHIAGVNVAGLAPLQDCRTRRTCRREPRHTFSGMYSWPCRQWALRARALLQSLRATLLSLITASRRFALQHQVWWHG